MNRAVPFLALALVACGPKPASHAPSPSNTGGGGGPPALDATEAIVAGLGDPARFAAATDAAAGVDVIDLFSGEMEGGENQIDHLCGDAATQYARALGDGVSATLGQTYEDDPGAKLCAIAGDEVECTFGATVEYDPYMRLDFRAGPDGAPRLARIIQFDRVLVGDDGVDESWRQVDAAIQQLAPRRCG